MGVVGTLWKTSKLERKFWKKLKKDSHYSLVKIQMKMIMGRSVIFGIHVG